MSFTDAAEGSAHYEAVRYVFENGLMLPKAEDAFGTDEPATAGDLYNALYVLIGGSLGDPEEAVATFAQYDLVPSGVDASTPLTNGLSDQIFSFILSSKIAYENSCKRHIRVLELRSLVDLLIDI